jgi:hypothetical protein
MNTSHCGIRRSTRRYSRIAHCFETLRSFFVFQLPSLTSCTDVLPPLIRSQVISTPSIKPLSLMYIPLFVTPPKPSPWATPGHKWILSASAENTKKKKKRTQGDHTNNKNSDSQRPLRYYTRTEKTQRLWRDRTRIKPKPHVRAGKPPEEWLRSLFARILRRCALYLRAFFAGALFICAHSSQLRSLFARILRRCALYLRAFFAAALFICAVCCSLHFTVVSFRSFLEKQPMGLVWPHGKKLDSFCHK